MLVNIQTSSSEMIPIKDFLYICDLAKCSKCQMFILLQRTNKLYGASDDGCCIHEIDVPFLVNTDLMFRLDMIPKELLESDGNFFIPADFSWTILPAYYWDMYRGGDIKAEYSSDTESFLLIDKTTNQPIQQIHTSKIRYEDDFLMQNFLNQLEGLLLRQSRLLPPITFQNMEQDPIVRKTYDGKTAIGRNACKLKIGDKDIVFYIFKGLFSLAKADTLEIDIRFDAYEKNLFMATFRPKKKKNPLTFNTYGVAFQEKIHCMYINMI